MGQEGTVTLCALCHWSSVALPGEGLQGALEAGNVYHTPNLLAPSSWFLSSKELRIKFLLQMTQFKAFGHRTNFYMDFEWTT